MKKAFEFFTNATLTVAFMAILYMVVVALFPPQVLNFPEARQKVLNPNHEVKIGTDVNIIVHVCKYFPIAVNSAETHLNDGVEYDLDVPIQPIGMGCQDIPMNINIPPVVEPYHPVRVSRFLYYRLSLIGDPIKIGWISEDFIPVP